jgi:hypothetical protein
MLAGVPAEFCCNQCLGKIYRVATSSIGGEGLSCMANLVPMEAQARFIGNVWRQHRQPYGQLM